jgi:hypothetical protein
MAINFTDSPSNGDTITADGRNYTYNSSTEKWKITSSTAANPTLTATASGAIANGDMVIVNSNGTVSAVSGTTSSAAAGSAAVFEDSTTTLSDATFDSNSNKVVVAYLNTYNKGTAVVGTVSGTSISFGTPVVFENGATNEIAVVFDSNANKVVIGYKDDGNSNYGTAIVGTVSGTSISFGSPVVFNSGNTTELAATFDSSANKVVFAYRDVGNSSYGTAIVGTVSGTSISFGSETIYYSGINIKTALCFDSTNSKVIVAYRAHTNSQCRCRVGTVSGTSISFPSSHTSFNNNDTIEYTQLVHDSSNEKTVLIYRDGGNNIYGTAVVGTVSGTTISFGSEVVFNSNTTDYISAHFASNINKVVIGYKGAGATSNGSAIAGTVSGTSISFGTPITFATTNVLDIGNTFDSNEGRSVFPYTDYTDNVEGKAVALQAASSTSTNLTASNYIGIADAAYSNSATATVQLIGSVDDAQSGLTAGQSYYIQNDGTLSTTAGSPSVLAGTAISATKLIVKSEIAAAAAAGLLIPGGGVTTYANIAALPSSGNTGGDLAFVTDVKAFYGWDGTEWDRVFSGKNMLPEFTTSPAASYNLASDGTATTVTVAATDPEGFAVSYSHDTSPTNQAQATITQSGGTFTVTPSTTESNAGTFTARFKAFDGVRTNSVSSTFGLNFQQFFAPQSLSSATLINSGGNAHGAGLPRGFGVDASNRIYYVNFSTSTLYQWDISNIISEETASPSGGVNSISSVSIPGTKTNTYYMGVCISRNGNYVFIADSSATYVTLKRYELTTAFDISTIQSPSTDTFAGSMSGYVFNLSISEDGTILYMGEEEGRIRKLVMTTAFDLSTASITQSTSADGNNVQYLDPTGTRVLDALYTSSSNSSFGDSLLSTPHDLSTIGSRSNVTTATTSQVVMGAWTADGNYAIIGSQSTDKVFVYKLT